MTEQEIDAFWQSHPCGDSQVGGPKQKDLRSYKSFFDRYDKYRYKKERHILKCLDEIDFKGKRTLEIGLGQGADSEQIIRRGAIWSGLDLTEESVSRVKIRFIIHAMPYESIKQGSVINIPFAEHSFDIIFCHGILHHVPDIQKAQEELHRILKPDGELIVMLYAKWSLNYILSIGLFRRLGLLWLYTRGGKTDGIYSQHVMNAREIGLWNYLKMKNFIHRNTDGPLNPYSKVYSIAQARKDLSRFQVLRAKKCFMHAPPLRIGWLPLARLAGWHLWIHMKPRKAMNAIQQSSEKIENSSVVL